MWINAAQSDLACLVTGDTKLAGLLGLNMRLLLRRGLVCRPPDLARGFMALAQGGAYVVKRGWLALEIGFAVGALAPTLSYVAPRLRPAYMCTCDGRRAPRLASARHRR